MDKTVTSCTGGFMHITYEDICTYVNKTRDDNYTMEDAVICNRRFHTRMENCEVCKKRYNELESLYQSTGIDIYNYNLLDSIARKDIIGDIIKITTGNDHQHISGNELRKYRITDIIDPDFDDWDFINTMNDKLSNCPVCWKRFKFFDLLSDIMGDPPPILRVSEEE